ncbi:MAG: phage virion morphogenesis protein [Verrucomicrobiaceae bacterium]|nr:phage virion morphogenesis protein [Verrucomicrobiaceae bacterium]
MPGLSLHLHKDEISPSLDALAAPALKQRMLDAAGTLITSLAQRAFDEPSLRPSSWPRRKDKLPHPLLVRSGDLRASLYHKVNGDEVVIGSPKKDYAAHHQLGSSKASGRGSGIPARPYFPVLNGQLTDEAVAELDDIMSALIGGAAGG